MSEDTSIMKRLLHQLSLLRQYVSLGPNETPPLSHLPFRLVDALRDLVYTRITSAKLQEGFYKENFVVVCGMPKSASTLVGTLVSEIGLGGGNRDRKRVRAIHAEPAPDQ